MPVLRLFAAAREAAGEARVEIEGSTVGDVLAAARDRFGEPFTSVLARCRIWVNGQPADASMWLEDHDVVAVLPPVSGGAGTATAPLASPDLAPPPPLIAPAPPPAAAAAAG